MVESKHTFPFIAVVRGFGSKGLRILAGSSPERALDAVKVYDCLSLGENLGEAVGEGLEAGRLDFDKLS